MLTFTTDQQTAISLNATQLCRLWKIIRRDGVAICLTEHDQPISQGGDVYHPMSTLSTTANSRNSGLKERDREYRSVVTSDLITEADLWAGRYRDAYIIEKVVDWSDLDLGVFYEEKYWVEETRLDGFIWVANAKSVMSWAQQRFGRTYERDCAHSLGDAYCTVDVEALKTTGVTVSSVTNRSRFICSLGTFTAGHYDGGRLVWTSGPNNGTSHIIKTLDSTTKEVTLWLDVPFTVVAGNAFTVYPGCDKLFSTCKTKFSNGINFGGFPHLVTRDEAIAAPDSKA